MGKKFYILLFSLFLANIIKSQLTTSQTLTPQQLVQNVLLGGGVTASNITFIGNAATRGTFNGVTSNIGLPSGVLLSCGANVNAVGPNNSSQVNVDNGLPGDPDLDIIMAPVSSFDATILEFDFVPSSDTIKFRYVFGSEEYMEYVSPTPGGINDGFGFFMSGPGITGPFANNAKNIAIIPGTTLPVTMYNLNLNTNSAFYFDNGDGNGSGTAPDGTTIQYDGFTIPLTALTAVQCGQTYHIKIAIADGGDGIIDSGVFLEGGSFSSLPPLNVFTTNSNSNIPDSILVEDCNTYCAYFIRNGNLANIDSFNLQVSGNALLGPDYIQSGNTSFTWPTKLIFGVGQDTIKICNLNALQDNLTEGTDTIKFVMSSFVTNTLSCLSSNAIKFNLYIKDYTPISIGQNNTSVCTGNSIVLNAGATNGYAPYTYTWTAPAVNTATFNTGPINSTQNYTITVNDICNKPVTQTITINPVSIPTVVSTNTVICSGSTATLIASGATTYTWSNGAINDSSYVNPSANTTYTVIGANGVCTNSAVSTVTVIGFSISITGNNSICLGQTSTLTASGSPSTYVWNNGVTTNSIAVSPTVTTTYTVSSTAASCSNTAFPTVTVTSPPTLTVSGTPYCAGQTTTVTATGASSYSWSTGSTTNSIVVAPLGNTTYTVVGSSIPSCTSSVVFTPSLIITAPQIINTSPVIFCLDSIKAITVRIEGGNQPFTVSWLIPGGGIVPFDTTNYTFYFTQSSAPSTGSYTIIVTDQCLYSDTLAIDINSIDCDILAPNVVTPNGDGVNDYFKINGLNNFPGSSLNVFNRWGNKLYSNDDYKNDWSPNVTDGTYFYIVDVSDGRKLNGFFQVFKE
ncbi:MAG: choice-of-anchor L domain-containing protein [Bacteroidia bacterium]|nr:choice-of-anchor L domain-containing protein [Bacteroidia bacterium]